VPAAPAAGLLARAAPITQYSWRELFEHFTAGIERARRFLDGQPPTPPVTWDRLNAGLRLATQVPLERFFAGLPLPADATAPVVPRGQEPRGDLVERLWSGATSPGLAGGRVACLAELGRAGRNDLQSAGLERLQAEGLGGAAVDHLLAGAKAAAGDLEGAFRLCAEALGAAPAVEYEAFRVRHLAAIARRWGRPELALPHLRTWLERFPDAQDSGPTWLDLATNALRSGGQYLDEAAEALARARVLLGEQLRASPGAKPPPLVGITRRTKLTLDAIAPQAYDERLSVRRLRKPRQPEEVSHVTGTDLRTRRQEVWAPGRKSLDRSRFSAASAAQPAAVLREEGLDVPAGTEVQVVDGGRDGQLRQRDVFLPAPEASVPGRRAVARVRRTSGVLHLQRQVLGQHRRSVL
jgi:hypothetical protein